MSVVWGAEGAQVRDVLLKLGQGGAVSKGLLNLACVFIFGSHGHHLRTMKRVREHGPPDLRARSRAISAAASCAWQRGLAEPEWPIPSPASSACPCRLHGDGDQPAPG